MFRTFENAVEIDFQLVPHGPVLVRSGVTTLDPAVAEMEFQRTHRGGRSTVFLAGSGLKGVLRSHGERILRTGGVHACDPNQRGDRDQHDDENLCFEQSKKKLTTSTLNMPFARQCAACFTFGSVHIAGRFHAHDAYPVEKLWAETNRTEARTQVGLDRQTQGPASGTGTLFEVEVVVGGAFEARVMGENFSLWQLGLLLQSLRDLHLGLVRVGGLKSRGMGTVRVRDLALTFRTLDRRVGWLTGAVHREGNEKTYTLPADDVLELPRGDGVEEEREGLFRTVRVTGDAATAVSEELITGPLSRFLKLEEAS